MGHKTIPAVKYHSWSIHLMTLLQFIIHLSFSLFIKYVNRFVLDQHDCFFVQTMFNNQKCAYLVIHQKCSILLSNSCFVSFSMSFSHLIFHLPVLIYAKCVISIIIFVLFYDHTLFISVILSQADIKSKV